MGGGEQGVVNSIKNLKPILLHVPQDRVRPSQIAPLGPEQRTMARVLAVLQS